ncbi:MAG: ornithine carbamoyltransferase [Planctomycetota bacterium]|jgi:ornithine carbamoyltransferase
MHLLKLSDWTSEEILSTIDLGIEVKAHPQDYSHKLVQRSMLMFFEKPSLRTRLSFEIGMIQMGGYAIFYNIKDSAIGKKESVHDFAKVACRFADIIMCRLFKQEVLEEIAENSSVPVINGLTDYEHPCQILADLMTVKEKKGKLEGLKLAYFGDSFNNVTHSLIVGCSKVGMDIAVGCPENKKMSPKPSVIELGREAAAAYGSKVEVFHDAARAAEGADVVYTDSWLSYHVPPAEEEMRKKVFMPYQVNENLMSSARPDAIFMNCLPAMRGYEQTAGVIDGPQSVVFDEAENRMHAQKAVILKLLNLV